VGLTVFELYIKQCGHVRMDTAIGHVSACIILLTSSLVHALLIKCVRKL